MIHVPKSKLNRLLSIVLVLGISLTVAEIALAVQANPGHDISTLGGVVQGDILYGSGTDVVSKLVKDANATRYLSNTGATNNPAWAQVNLANGVTGTIGTANLGSGTANSTTFLRGDSTWQAVGGGSPGGSNTQIQYNNGAGGFGADAGLTFDSTNQTLGLNGTNAEILANGITVEPSAPAAGKLIIYVKSIAGRMMPKWLAPSGVDTSFQSSLGFNRISFVAPGGGSTAATAMTSSGTLFTNSGTFANPTLASTNALTSTRRTTMSTGSTAATVASHRQSNLQVWRGASVAFAPGGFFFTVRFGMSVLASGNRAFVGLADSVSAPTNVDPTTSTAPGKIGLAIALNSGNWKFVHNVTGTAPAITDLGANFPVNTTDLYELTLYSKPNDTLINYRVNDLSTGNTTSGTTLTTNIPTGATFLAPLIWITNNATAANAALDLGGWYLESDQ